MAYGQEIPPARGRRGRWWQDIKVIGGLAAVSLGLAVVLLIATLAIIFVRGDAGEVATVASAAFSVVGTMVGAYFGVKIGTDQTLAAMSQTGQAMQQTQGAIDLMRQEAAKAQAFAAHLSADSAREALEAAVELAASGSR